MPIFLPLVLLLLLSGTVAARECVTATNAIVSTPSKRCPKGSKVLRESARKEGKAAVPREKRWLDQERDCTMLRQRVEAIDFRLRLGRPFADDARKRSRLQAQLQGNECD
jgi:hypothetical protein